MATAASITTTTTTPERTSENRRRVSHRDGLAVSSAPLPFDVTLDIARNALLSRVRRTGSNSESAEQVFEADGADPGQARVDAQRAQDERDAQQKAENETSPSSVKARRAEAAKTASSEQPAPRNASNQERAGELPGASARRDSDAGKVEPAVARDAPAAQAPSSRAAIASPDKASVEPTSPRVPARPQAAVSTSALPSAAPATERAASSSGEVAAKLGEVLGAQRGGMESVRATQATDPPPQGQGRSGRTPSKSQAPTPRSGDSRQTQPSDTTTKAERVRFDELVQSLRIRTGSHRSTARMHLKPPSLGRMRIDVRMEGERLQLDVRTETADATRLMQTRLRELQAALAEHGFTVERFDVEQQMHGAASDTSDGGPAFAGAEGRANRGTAPARLDEERSQPVPHGEGESMSHHVVAERRLDVRI